MKEAEQEKEGVIKFTLEYVKSDVIHPDQITLLNFWREKLRALHLIGQDPDRYDGLGYGNISHRHKQGSNEFIISGSQTAHLPVLDKTHYSLVIESDIEHNRLVARGLARPSSEALTHSAFYAADTSINFVFHVHSELIWNNAHLLEIAVTPATVAYGTAEMAQEIGKLFKSGRFDDIHILAMGGHRDGIIAFGATAEEAGNSILDVLEKLI